MAPPSIANVVGSDLQNFNATTSGIDYVTVHSTEPLDPGIFNSGFMLNYAVNSLPFYDNTQTRVDANDSLLMGEFLFGLGLYGGWEVGVSLTHLFRQAIDNEDIPHGEFVGTGWTNGRFNLKKRLFDRNPIGIGIMLTANKNNVRNNPYLGKGNNNIYSAELLLDMEFFGLVGSVNAGYRWRKKAAKIETSDLEPTPDQYIISGGLSYRLPYADTKLIAEVFASRPAEGTKTNTQRQASSMEALAGLKYDYNSNIALHIGGATELLHGQFSPDWRVYTGLNWALGPVFKKKEAPASQTSKEVRVVLRSTNFNFNSDDLGAEAIAFLKDIARDLETFDVSSVSIEGHTDSVGAEEYNLQLSVNRAITVKKNLERFLKRKDIKLNIKGHGETKPIASNNNFQGREKNRRVEIIYFKK